jgi:hypothetical protein
VIQQKSHLRRLGEVRLSMEGAAADAGGPNQSFENSDGDLSDASDAMLAEPDDQLANATTSESDGESMACVAASVTVLEFPSLARSNYAHILHRMRVQVGTMMQAGAVPRRPVDSKKIRKTARIVKTEVTMLAATMVITVIRPPCRDPPPPPICARCHSGHSGRAVA